MPAGASTFETPEPPPHQPMQVLLGDKDALLNAIQSSHDARVARIDGLEDRLVRLHAWIVFLGGGAGARRVED
jgi:hypothetical protein